MVVARQKVELLEKNKPRQERAKRTYESILSRLRDKHRYVLETLSVTEQPLE